MICVEGLSHTVASGDQQVTILDNLTFTIRQGETVAITGSSGSGKTTLLAMLAGLNIPVSGDIWVDNACISSMDEDQRAHFRAQSVGFVFQSFHLLSGLTAIENVSLPLELAGHAASEKQARTYLEQVGLKHRLDHLPGQLSGGEQQRVAIARAFASEPRYLFADEPTGNLDQKTGARIIELLFSLNKNQQTTLILVTHEQRLAERCQRQLNLSEGYLTEIHLS